MARRKEYRESKGKTGMYDMSKSHVSQTYTSDWSDGQEGAMMQEDNGSMNYYKRKGSLDKSDTARIKGSALPQM